MNKFWWQWVFRNGNGTEENEKRMNESECCVSDEVQSKEKERKGKEKETEG